MATKIVNATFTSTVTDSITLNGKTYGNTNTNTAGSCNEAYERVFHVPPVSATQCWIPILSATTEPDSGGDVTFGEFEYARFTNCDDEYPIWLKFTNTDGICTDTSGASQCFCVKLDAGATYLTPSSQWLATGSDIDCTTILAEGGRKAKTQLQLPTFWTVHAIAHTTVCDLEMFVVTT
jgi:hypothetical protein|tara:strand:+ start:28587 stop:29123 length:537 start_codon:yes stop_codon:yes gene_type:complete